MHLLPGLALAAALAANTGAGRDGADAGRRLFEAKGCYACHGREGQGGVAGPKLAPGPIPLEAMRAFVRNSAPTLMPPYSSRVLSDAEISAIHDWLSRRPKAPDPSTLPLLQH